MKYTTLKVMSKNIISHINFFLILLGVLTFSNEIWDSFSGDNVLDLAIVSTVSLIVFDLIKYVYCKVRKSW